MSKFNPTNKSDVEKFFKGMNKIIKDMRIEDENRDMIADVKRELMTYDYHEIHFSEDVLIVGYIVDNKQDFSHKEFDLQDFYAWAKENCDDKAMWSTTVQSHFDGDDYITESVFDVENYVEANEDMLVKEYWNLKK